MDSKLEPLYNTIRQGDQDTAEAALCPSFETGFTPAQLLNQTMVPAMSEAGCRFEKSEYYVPEMAVGARVMQGGRGLLRPLLGKQA